MTKRPGGRAAAALLAAAAALCPAAAGAGTDDVLANVKLPPGFRISLFAEVPGARSMAVSQELKAIFVGTLRDGRVFMVGDTDGDGRAEFVFPMLSGLDMPNGIALSGETLFVAENAAVYRHTIKAAIRAPIFRGLPRKRHHGWRYAGVGPDGRLYVSVGSPCNICDPEGIEGTIIRMGQDGRNVETFARGIRNSVGFDWHPRTGEMFFTDNGADGMGDDVPPDELNRVTAPGQHFGFPYLGGHIPLAGYEGRTPPEGAVAPAVEFQAHVAALGIHFYNGAMFPEAYRGDAFVAQHGSWNRSSKVGYRVMRIRFDESGNPTGKEVFADGWRDGESTLGRPVDIKTYIDGSLLVSDDYNGAIYRITYRQP